MFFLLPRLHLRDIVKEALCFVIVELLPRRILHCALSVLALTNPRLLLWV
jgi:hypothetical protein